MVVKIGQDWGFLVSMNFFYFLMGSDCNNVCQFAAKHGEGCAWGVRPECGQPRHLPRYGPLPARPAGRPAYPLRAFATLGGTTKQRNSNACPCVVRALFRPSPGELSRFKEVAVVAALPGPVRGGASHGARFACGPAAARRPSVSARGRGRSRACSPFTDRADSLLPLHRQCTAVKNKQADLAQCSHSSPQIDAERNCTHCACTWATVARAPGG